MKYPVSIRWTQDCELFFKRLEIFLGHHNRIDGVIKHGTEVVFRCPVVVEPRSTMPWGSFMNMGSFSYSISALSQETSVGRYCCIAKGCEIMGVSHPIDRISVHHFSYHDYWASEIRSRFGRGPTPDPFDFSVKPVRIENDVWIGQDVLIKGGITIGTGAVVAARSVVTKDVPPYAIVAGSPAKIVRYRFGEDLIIRLLNSKWWTYHVSDFGGLNMNSPSQFLDGLEDKIKNTGLAPYIPDNVNIPYELHKI